MNQEDPKKKPVDQLFILEQERWRRRRELMDKKFQTTIQHLDDLAKVNEEYYKTKKAMTESAKTNVPVSAPAPVVPRPPLFYEPPQPLSPLQPPSAPPMTLRSPWPRSAPLPKPVPKPKSKGRARKKK